MSLDDEFSDLIDRVDTVMDDVHPDTDTWYALLECQEKLEDAQRAYKHADDAVIVQDGGPHE